MMMNRSWTTTAVLCGAIAAPLACTAEQLDPDPEIRTIVFEADDVRAARERDSSTTFLVDLRGPAIYEFEQPGEPIELAAFEVLAPGMDSPVPLTELLSKDEVDVDLEAESWALRSVDQGSFRNGPFHQDPDGGDYWGCTELCYGQPQCIQLCGAV